MIDQALLGLILFAVGAYFLYKTQRSVFLVLFLPLLFILAASALHKYPFKERAVLFYVPFLYLFIAKGLSVFFNNRRFSTKFIGTILLGLILYSPLIQTAKELAANSFYLEEIRPVLNYVEKHKQKEDIIYVYYGADAAFRYYRETYGYLSNETYIKGAQSRDDWGKYKDDLAQVTNKERVWIVFSHVYSLRGNSEKEYIIHYLNAIGKKLDSVHAPRASAYLYTFIKPADSRNNT